MNEPENPPVLAQVAPRYLVGGGDPRWVTAPLQKAFRWQPAHIPLSPVVRLTRRDRQAELLLSPDPDEHWWTLHHAGTTAGEKAWTMRFGARTPAEIIAAATDALTTGPADSAADPMQVLLQAGWKRSVLEHQISSPDGFVIVSRHPLGALHIEVTAHDGPWTSEPTARTAWRAFVSDHTPPHLAAAVLDGMVSTEPLLRDEKAMAPFLRYSVRIARERVPAHRAEYALWDRVDRLAAHRTGTPLPPQQPGRSLPRRTR
ncbi:DUF317 domain-containing protein [Streptomyces sp. NBC_00160]|uniref:DUF317 domain-containing protein n=1 Tax=Streptomyces sp. NBC_00160 TaxID=2903628 RepID=UPI002254594E|nr:DUF317 domain-containing protein [Streptomyces sp. NBC_00160]MCX5309005.1 DUF317 domain-containing protein [Streptomyces sp. NBC_00160]